MLKRTLRSASLFTFRLRAIGGGGRGNEDTMRKSTGTVRWRNGAEGLRFYARYTLSDGKSKSPWTPLDPNIQQHDMEGAYRYAAQFVGTAKALKKGGEGESVAAYSLRWLAQRDSETERRDCASHLKTHILDVIGNVSVLALTSAHGDEMVAYLDRAMALGTMSDKTARNVWATCKRMMKSAAHAKPSTGLRCLDSNPFRDVMGPERSRTKKGKSFLYPSEFVAFVSHPKVPVNWKRNLSIGVFLGLRDVEQRALRWEHCDLEHGVVNVCEVYDRSLGRVREGTKSGEVRQVPIPPPLIPLLRSMHAAAEGKGLVCKMASQRAMARGLRTWLRVAGVTRESLFKTTSVSLNLRWHDARATCGSWHAAMGRSGPEIRDVLGHARTEMTDVYMRNATPVRGGLFGTPFPELPPIGHRRDIGHPELTIRPEISSSERGGRDSNPRPPA
jgi:integrase